MENTRGSGGNGGGGDGDRPRVNGIEAMSPRIEDQMPAEAPTVTGAGISGGSDGDGGHAAEASSGEEWRAPVDLGCTPVELGPVGLQVRRLDYQTGVEAVIVPVVVARAERGRLRRIRRVERLRR